MRQIAIVGFGEAAQDPAALRNSTTSGVELLVPVFQELLGSLGLTKDDIGFWCSGSSDYLAGRAFSFVNAVDAIGAVPPIVESHVEMDAAWALYEAWIKLLTGEMDTALVYGFGKASAGDLNRVLALQLDPYLVAPLWPDAHSIAALQARLGLDQGLWTEAEMAQVARNAGRERSDHTIADPLREHDIAPYVDGASAIVLAAGDRARELCPRPAWITGFAHRVDAPALGVRDLTKAPSAAAAAQAAGATGVEIAELYAPYTHQELILRRELQLNGTTRINPSGGVLGSGHAMFSAGLSRIGHAARYVIDGQASRVLGHATSGPALQQNLVCAMESK